MNLGATSIRGWMNDHELWWLAEQAKKHYKIIEVGCAWGRSTRVLADNKSAGFIYAIDTWLGSPNELETNHKEFKDKNGDAAYLEFCGNLWFSILVGKVIPFRMTSLNAAGFFAEKQIKADFIFLDACHDEEAVDQDIAAYTPLVRKGGILAGHDYNHPQWTGVTAAVNKHFAKVETPQPHIWMVQL